MESLSKFSKLKKFFLLFLVITFLFFSALGAGNKLYADNNITVFIDPGHGGSDPGCVHNGLNEKDVNLTVSLKLKSKLEQNGYRVVMSRTTDIYRSLDERVNMANVSGANIFLSIHGNAWYEPDANGTETYWSPSGAAGSSQFATVIQKNLVKSINRRDRGVKTADFKVIKYTKMTSALVEYVFLSNPEEAQLLKSDTFLNKIVEGLFNGVKEYSLSIASNQKILIGMNYPKNDYTVSETIKLWGWAVENSATVDTGITKIHVYDGPYRGSSENFLGVATYGLSRPDVATYFGKENYTNSGYSLDIDTTKLTNGQHILYVYAYNVDIGWKYTTVKINVANNVPANQKILIGMNYPKNDYTVSETIKLWGWAVENSATVDTGITKIHVYDGPYRGSSENFLGVATYGLSRPDVATYFGKENYTNSGYSLDIDTTKLTNGQHILYVYAYNVDIGWKYTTVKINVANGAIDNNTNIIGKVNATEEQLLSLFISRNSNQIDRARRLAPLYIKWGNTFNIRYDIAWAQMCHETGFLEYTGNAKPDWNNFCGLGVTGAIDENGEPVGCKFTTEELGIIAHYIHLAWYVCPDHLTLKDSNGDLYCSTKYDPRHFGSGHNYNGSSNLGCLNGRWAPSPDYTYKVIKFANEIYN